MPTKTPETTPAKAGGGQLPSYHLSEEQAKFAAMLIRYPRLFAFWDFEQRGFDVANFEQALGVFSHGERIIAEFFVGLWRGDNKYNFDFFEAAKVLDAAQLAEIQNWLNDPFFP